MAETDLGRNTRTTRKQLVIAILVGLFVWGLSLLVAWKLSGIAPGVGPEQSYTQHILIYRINHAISEYEKEHDEKVESLYQLLDDGYLEITTDGKLLDGWENPMVVEYDGTQLIFTSYGRDGKPGGKGLDHDLTNLDPSPDGAIVTFYQFLFNAPIRSIRLWSFAIGVFTFIAIINDRGSRKKQPWRHNIVNISVFIIAACIVAGFMSILQLYSGH